MNKAEVLAWTIMATAMSVVFIVFKLKELRNMKRIEKKIEQSVWGYIREQNKLIDE